MVLLALSPIIFVLICVHTLGISKHLAQIYWEKSSSQLMHLIIILFYFIIGEQSHDENDMMRASISFSYN